jgi:hypothetical protein
VCSKLPLERLPGNLDLLSELGRINKERLDRILSLLVNLACFLPELREEGIVRRERFKEFDMDFVAKIRTIDADV